MMPVHLRRLKMTKKIQKKNILWIAGGLIVLVGITILILIQSVTPKENDFSKLSWTDAFEQLHTQISAKYPFTEWKNIDWDDLYTQTASRIAQAETENDISAYYLALREYVYAIPDAHVQIGGPDFGLRKAAVGGEYGFGIIGLDDGRVIANMLLEDGPASKAGMDWGAEILAWNEMPIHEALAKTSTIWAQYPQATNEGRLIEQCRFLVRDPARTEITLIFQNPDENEPQTVRLIAVPKQTETKNNESLSEEDLHKIFSAPVEYEILSNGYGYISISGFMPTLGGLNPARLFDKAIEEFIKAEVSSIIIDVRANGGGLDGLVPKMVGHFYNESGFYEYISVYNVKSGEFVIDPKQTLTIEPRAPYFAGPVVVLVNNHTASTAEGIPMSIQPLFQGYVVGIYGTNGSFAAGNPGENLFQMPEGLAVNFLGGRALDQDQTIQVDSNADGMGGITPDIRVPLTEENVRAMYVDGVDIVLETAISTLDELN